MAPRSKSAGQRSGRTSRVLDAAVGKRIRLLRKRADLTLHEVGHGLGVAYQQVQKYETGVNRIGAGRLLELAQILGVHVNAFFEGIVDDKGRLVSGAEPTDTVEKG